MLTMRRKGKEEEEEEEEQQQQQEQQQHNNSNNNSNNNKIQNKKERVENIADGPWPEHRRVRGCAHSWCPHPPPCRLVHVAVTCSLASGVDLCLQHTMTCVNCVNYSFLFDWQQVWCYE